MLAAENVIQITSVSCFSQNTKGGAKVFSTPSRLIGMHGFYAESILLSRVYTTKNRSNTEIFFWKIDLE